MKQGRTDELKDAARALLLGVAAGDALGVPMEFKARGTFHVTDMIGHGTNDREPGTWSDDTSLTLALIDVLTPAGCDMDDLAQALQAWYYEGRYTPGGKAFDCGRATREAIERLHAGASPARSGGTGEHDNGNGSLMRVAPLVFFLVSVDDPRRRYETARAVSAVTHGHPIAAAACFFYLEVLLHVFRGAAPETAYMKMRRDAAGCGCLASETLTAFSRLLQDDIRALREDKIRSDGYVVHTLEAAIWCVLTSSSYREAVLKAVNLGEDTDTTAAVTGALAGLAYGWRAIPRTWLARLVAKELLFRAADDLAGKFA